MSAMCGNCGLPFGKRGEHYKQACTKSHPCLSISSGLGTAPAKVITPLVRYWIWLAQLLVIRTVRYPTKFSFDFLPILVITSTSRYHHIPLELIQPYCKAQLKSGNHKITLSSVAVRLAGNNCIFGPTSTSAWSTGGTSSGCIKGRDAFITTIVVWSACRCLPTVASLR